MTPTSPLMVADWLPPRQATDEHKDTKIDGSRRQSDDARGAPRPVHHASGRQQNGEGEPAKPNPLRYSGRPKEPQQRSPIHDTKATATPLHPTQREDRRAGTRDAQTAPQFHRQTTATTPQSEQNLPTKRTAPRHANRRRPNTKRQQTDTEATRQTTPTHGTNQPPRPRRAAPTSAGTRTRTPPRRTPAATEPKDRDTRRTGHETADRKQAQETTQQGDRAHTTTQPHNAHNKRQRTEARGGNKQRRQATQTPPRHQKHQKHQHGEKPKNKSKKDGSWRQTVEREKVASSETTVRARSTRTTTEEAR